MNATPSMIPAAGDSAQACRWLEQAYAERNPGLIFIRGKFHFQQVHTYPCVTRIIERMKFPPARSR